MKNFQPKAGVLVKGAATLLFALVTAGSMASMVNAAPFQLGAEAQGFIESAPPQNNSYPSGQMLNGNAAQYGQNNTYSGNVQQQRPLQAQVQKSVALPPKFLGSWLVQGQRTGIEAQPQYQQGIEGLFAGGTRNTWNIAGSPQQGYQMSNDQGVSTTLTIYKVMNNQAFIRYQHPIGKTMAQEAIVMELQNGGATFQGLERISIVKDGQQPPRAKVTYQLFGQRQ
ncbi:MAG: hypothetical protein JST01_02335 [Cyanobacteria bacterium SZAS TMP-1]|nr:hypothetical protein [Cyanobacteria bacterium SZAS TMP-1]